MSKLRVLSGREVCDLLMDNGFSFARHGKGDHDIYQKITDDTTITVPVPLHREIAIGTLMSIIRQSGLPRSVFEA